MSELPLDDLIKHWVRPEIQALCAYPVPDASGMIKLDAMENPYDWPGELRGAWAAALGSVAVNRYPDPQASRLKARLREAMGIPGEMGLLLGNGSDEIIQMIALTLAGPGRALLSVEPGFVMYRMIATLCGMKYLGVPLRDEDFGLDMPALVQAIEEHQPAVVFLAHPNNPTGNLFDEAEMLRVIDQAPGLVVVDEAYAPFADRSFMPRLGKLDNLLVMRTVSKMGLAGLRLGMLVGAPRWIEQIDKTRLPYNVNVLTQAAGEHALARLDVLDAQARSIREERASLLSALQATAGIRAYPSAANFLLLRVPEGRAREIFEGLRRRRVLVKTLDGSHPLLHDCLRVTVGKPEENRAFVEALRAAL